MADLWRGRMTCRRCLTLIKGLPPGSGLHRVNGGEMAWSDETAAILRGLWHLETVVLSLFAKKGTKPPAAPAPPEIGWKAKQERDDERMRRKVARLKARTQRAQ